MRPTTMANRGRPRRVLPYMDEMVAFKNIKFNSGSEEVTFPDGTLVQTVRIATYICPSEQNDTVKISNGTPASYPHSYGVNMGSWFVYNPVSDSGGSGAFFPNAQLTPSRFPSGLSKTLLAAEVKAYTPYLATRASPPCRQLRAIPPRSARSVEPPSWGQA